MNYAEFIATKATNDVESGFDPSNLGDAREHKDGGLFADQELEAA